jgi:hypothetical protein
LESRSNTTFFSISKSASRFVFDENGNSLRLSQDNTSVVRSEADAQKEIEQSSIPRLLPRTNRREAEGEWKERGLRRQCQHLFLFFVVLVLVFYLSSNYEDLVKSVAEYALSEPP